MSVPASYHSASYRAWLNEELGATIESKELGLSNLQKNYLRSRWLEQVLRMEYEVSRALKRHQALRLMAAIGSLAVLMLVSLRLDDQKLVQFDAPLRYATVLLSLLVAASIGIEHLFNYGERQRQYQHKLERLKTEGWRFFELSGHYRHYASHAEAFPAFTSQVEDLTQREVEVYSSRVTVERRKGGAPEVLELPKKLEQPPTDRAAATAAAHPQVQPPAQSHTAPAVAVRDVVSRRLNHTRAQ